MQIVNQLVMNMSNALTKVNFDPSIYHISPTKIISTPLSMNFSIINGLYLMYQSIWKAIEEFPDAIIDIMKDGAEVIDCHYGTKL